MWVFLLLFICPTCGAQNKKLAHFGKLTKKDEPTLSGFLAIILLPFRVQLCHTIKEEETCHQIYATKIFSGEAICRAQRSIQQNCFSEWL